MFVSQLHEEGFTGLACLPSSCDITVWFIEYFWPEGKAKKPVWRSGSTSNCDHFYRKHCLTTSPATWPNQDGQIPGKYIIHFYCLPDYVFYQFNSFDMTFMKNIIHPTWFLCFIIHKYLKTLCSIPLNFFLLQSISHCLFNNCLTILNSL